MFKRRTESGSTLLPTTEGLYFLVPKQQAYRYAMAHVTWAGFNSNDNEKHLFMTDTCMLLLVHIMFELHEKAFIRFHANCCCFFILIYVHWQEEKSIGKWLKKSALTSTEKSWRSRVEVFLLLFFAVTWARYRSECKDIRAVAHVPRVLNAYNASRPGTRHRQEQEQR